ncbi:unnamed protein product [Pylaiella littoralis]
MLVFKTIERFCRSADRDITMRHVWIPTQNQSSPSSQRKSKKQPPPAETWVLDCAREAWESIKNPLEPKNRPLPKCFSSVLKEFQRSSPDLSFDFDLIMLDEAQDMNDCQAHIIGMQTKCRVIVVGDPHQGIYAWRGAKDYLKKAKCFKTLRLTQCFRFGTGIASVANTVLLELKKERQPLLASSAFSEHGPAKVLFGDDRNEWLQQDYESKGRYAFIARTNEVLTMEAIASIGGEERVAFQGGSEDAKKKLKLNDIKYLCHMIRGEMKMVFNKELKEIGSIQALRKELEEAAEDRDTEGSDLFAIAWKLNMVDNFMAAGKGPEKIMEDVERVKKMALTTDAKGPLKILTTVHSAKGLEFDTVVMADDFSFERLVGGKRERKPSNQDANLLYVAVTRARRQLILNPKLARQLQAFHMWDSLALQGRTSDPTVTDRVPVPCHGRGCSNVDARGLLAAENPAAVDASGSAGEGGQGLLMSTLLFAGSGSKRALCQACVKGVAGEEENRGLFPYAAEFFTPREAV